MFDLTIVFGPTGAGSKFLFKERGDAEKMLSAIKNTATDIAAIKDDFGSHAEFKTAQIHAMIISDLASDDVIEREIQRNKISVKFNNRAANDPMLKLALAPQMAMNHPGAPNGARRPFGHS